MIFSRYAAIAAAVASAIALSACSTVDLDQGKSAEQTSNATLQEMLQAKDGPLAKREVYFDFDSYTVSPDQMTVVANHAKALAANKQVKVTLEGNTDERGGREYNLALGQKRADAVRQRMTLMGVSPDQIETVSFGKEKPRATGSTEADYAENRRVDIRYHANTLPQTK